MRRVFLPAIVLLFIAFNTLNAQDKICQTWYTEDGLSAVQFYKAADGMFYGKLVWIKEEVTTGQTMYDVHNPDRSKRGATLMGLEIVTGLKKKTDEEYINGKIYDPSKGNYYNCKMTVSGKKLILRGYIWGMPFLGRTTIWYLKEDTPKPKKNVVATPALQSDTTM